FCSHYSLALRALPSFPTRRSSDLPFLPMLPKQILLNSFLYDVAQITIPYDDVDARYTRKPRRWDIGLIKRFMLFIGPISSVYDLDRKSTRLNSSHVKISYAVFCLK